MLHWFPNLCDPMAAVCQAPLCLIPGLGCSLVGGNSNPFQYSSLENPVNRGAWQDTIHGAAKSQIGLSTHTHALSSTSSILYIRYLDLLHL